jgi:hypothetical protein
VTSFLGDLAGRMGERWAATAALPGLVFLAVAAVAVTVGHGGALDFAALRAMAEAASGLEHLSSGAALLLIAGAIGAAMAAAASSQAIGRALERHWFKGAQRTFFPWGRMSSGSNPRRVPPGRERLVDMFSRARHRLQRDRDIDLATVWPVLWLSLPDASRSEVVLARSGLRGGAVMIGWGLMYAALGAVWWPGLLIGAVLLWNGRARSRAGMGDYLRAINAAVLLHAPDLIAQFGLGSHSPPIKADYARLTLHLQDGPEWEYAVLDPEP